MLQCGDIVKNKRLGTDIEEVLIVLSITTENDSLYNACHNSYAYDKESFISYVSANVDYICMHITYIDGNMDDAVNMDYIRKCVEHCMQNPITRTVARNFNKLAFLYHVNGMVEYIAKNRLLDNINLPVITEEEYINYAEEFYEKVKNVVKKELYKQYNSEDLTVNDFKLGRLYVEQSATCTSFFVPVATQDDKLVTLEIATYRGVLTLDMIIGEVLDYSNDIDENGYLLDYNIVFIIRQIDKLSVAITETPLVLQSDKFADIDLKEDSKFKEDIKNNLKVEPENLFAY